MARADGPMRTTSFALPPPPALRPMQNRPTSYPLARTHQDASCAAMPPPPPGRRPGTHQRKTTTQTPWAPPWARRRRGPSQQACYPAGGRACSTFSSRGVKEGVKVVRVANSDFGRTQIGLKMSRRTTISGHRESVTRIPDSNRDCVVLVGCPMRPGTPAGPGVSKSHARPLHQQTS